MLVEVVCLDVGYHFGVEIATDTATFCDELADEGAAHVVETGVDEAHAGGQRGGVNGIAIAGIDDDGIVSDYVTAVAPLRENVPVVGTDD